MSLLLLMPSQHTETRYSKWLRSALNKRGIDLAELGRVVNSDYNYMWRLSAGVRKRPGYEIALAIGEALKDVEGSLQAAEFSRPGATDDEGSQITYEQDLDSIPIPEGSRDVDDPIIRAAASAAAQKTYEEVVNALRTVREESPGTYGFGGEKAGRYPKKGKAEEPDTTGETDKGEF